MRKSVKAILCVSVLGFVTIGGFCWYSCNFSKDSMTNLIATKTVDVDKMANSNTDTKKGIDFNYKVNDSFQVDEIKDLGGGRYSINGKEVSYDEYYYYMFSTRVPMEVVYSDRENKALLQEAEYFYNMICTNGKLNSGLELYKNFETYYKNFKDDSSPDNYRLLLQSLGAVEISLGYGG